MLANEPYGFLNTNENTLFQAQIVFKRLGVSFYAESSTFKSFCRLINTLHK